MMRRLGAAALVAAACLAPTALRAQDGFGGASRFEIGVYGGGTWTSPWLENDNDVRLGIGFNPSVAGVANLWLTPRLGAHLHFAYLPSNPPRPDREIPVEMPGGRLHNLAYDLALAFRPFAGGDPDGALESFYVFAGGGAFTVHVTGDTEGVPCIPVYDEFGACLAYDWRDATVAQGTAGAGVALLPVTRRVAMFAEGGLHVYRSPFRFGPEWTGREPCEEPGCGLSGPTTIGYRLGVGVAVRVGAFAPPRPRRPSFPGPAPRPGSGAIVEVPITVCVAVDGMPQYVDARIRQPSGDTVIVAAQQIRRPLRAAYPVAAPSAAGRDWFGRAEPVFLDGQPYIRSGATRPFVAGEFERFREYEGVPLYAAAGAALPPDVLYVPVEDGCTVQPYRRP